MNAFEGLAFGFSIALQWQNLLACFTGVLIGTVVGVLPGIGPIGAMALLLPVTYSMTPAGALIMLAGIYYGSMYGGSTTSILLKVPGEVSSVITVLDGYEMARRGRAEAASTGAKNARPRIPIEPAANEPTAATNNAAPARPRRAIS